MSKMSPFDAEFGVVENIAIPQANERSGLPRALGIMDLSSRTNKAIDETGSSLKM